MSDDPATLSTLMTSFGLKINVLIAGLAGGIVNAFVFRRSEPWSIIGSVVVGSLTANYIAEPAAAKLGTPEGASGFIVGLAGMAICQGIVAAAKAWRPSTNGATDVRPPS